MNPLTPARAKRITADWHSAFPGLGVYKPMWLLRRCGPILTGICLDRDGSGSEYVPTAHIHCLARTESGVRFQLVQQLRTDKTNAPYWIQVKWHENHWRDAAARMMEQSLLPLAGPLSLEQTTDALRHFKTHIPKGQHSVDVYEIWLLTLAWAGRREDVQRLLGAAEHDIATWPEYVITRDGGLSAWLEKMRHLTDAPEQLHRTVQAELVKHKVEDLPAVDVSTWLM